MLGGQSCDLDSRLNWVWEAFWELSTDRQLGLTIGPMPASSIDRFIDRNGLGDIEAQEFRTFMRAMDDEFRISNRRDKDQVQSRPLTPELFHALMGKS